MLFSSIGVANQAIGRGVLAMPWNSNGSCASTSDAPPSTSINWPAIQPASSEQSKATASGGRNLHFKHELNGISPRSAVVAIKAIISFFRF
jgi:hypothetical protein